VHGGKIAKKTEGADQVLVISSRPLVLGNMPPAGAKERYEKVAFMGQVPVKVVGRVRKGDFLVPDGREAGVARAVHPRAIVSEQLPEVLGVAWGASDSDGLNYVQAAVGLRSGELARVIQQQEDRIATLSARVARLESELARALTRVETPNPKDGELADLQTRMRRLENLLGRRDVFALAEKE
jgi:hypothetical protein